MRSPESASRFARPKSNRIMPSMPLGATSECYRNGQSLTSLLAFRTGNSRTRAPPDRIRHSQMALETRRWSTDRRFSTRPKASSGLQEPSAPSIGYSSESPHEVDGRSRQTPSLAGYADDGCAEAKNSDTSHGVQCLPTKSTSRIVTRRLASPTPSALRVSHPLSGLIPAHPCGCISSHIRP